MLSTVRRRTVAACTAFVLMLGFFAWNSMPAQADEGDPNVVGSIVLGERLGWEFSPKTTGVAVRFYQPADDPDQPWTLVGMTRSTADSSRFEMLLPAGTYRATFNEFDDGGSAWDTFRPGEEQEFEVVAGVRKHLPQVGLTLRGGIITGRVIDQCGSSPSVYNLHGFNTPEGTTDPDPGSQPILSSFDVGGKYEVHTLGGPTRFRITVAGIPAWADNAASYETATTFSVPHGQVQQHDLMYKRVVDLTSDFEGQTQEIRGTVRSPEGVGIPGLVVRFYRSPNGNDPWTFEDQVTTLPSSSSNPSANGTYRANLRPGEYKITVNEFDEATPASRVWNSASYGQPSSVTNPPVACLDAGQTKTGVNIGLTYRGETITGRVTDPRGNPIASATVEAFDAGDSAAVPLPALVVTTDANGEYTTHGTPGLTKLRFSKPSEFIAEWFDNAATFATSTAIDAGAGEPSTGNDVVLADGPIVSIKKPGFTGTAKYAGTVTASGDEWGPHPVTKTYQWFRQSGTTSTPITGARSASYTPTKSDLARRLWVRVTARPLPTYPGVASVSADSGLTGYVKRASNITTSTKSRNGKIILTVKVAVTGIKNPSGSLTIRYAKAKPVATGGWVSSGTVTTKKVSFKYGKATLIWKPTSLMSIYEVRYAGTSTIFADEEKGTARR